MNACSSSCNPHRHIGCVEQLIVQSAASCRKANYAPWHHLYTKLSSMTTYSVMELVILIKVIELFLRRFVRANLQIKFTFKIAHVSSKLSDWLAVWEYTDYFASCGHQIRRTTRNQSEKQKWTHQEKSWSTHLISDYIYCWPCFPIKRIYYRC